MENYFDDDDDDFDELSALRVDVVSEAIRWLESSLSHHIVDLLREDNEDAPYSVSINIPDFIQYSPDTAVKLLNNTSALLSCLNDALR